MTALLANIEGREAPPYYSHASVATGDRIIHMAGQVGSDETGRVVDGGLAAQAERAMLNLGLALDAAGASEDDLVKLTIYVVGWEPAKLGELGAGLFAAAEARPRPAVPITLLGVASLFEPDMLIEIEGVAVAA
jgi:enamine deaminase RidA (YjgF/YER057c/UK114 family)